MSFVESYSVDARTQTLTLTRPAKSCLDIRLQVLILRRVQLSTDEEDPRAIGNIEGTFVFLHLIHSVRIYGCSQAVRLS